jgi:hypothetical protein
MSKKVDGYQVNAIRQLRDEARELISDLFPKLSGLDFGFVTGEKGLEVVTTLGDTGTYPRDDVAYCLREAGVRVESPEAETA